MSTRILSRTIYCAELVYKQLLARDPVLPVFPYSGNPVILYSGGIGGGIGHGFFRSCERITTDLAAYISTNLTQDRVSYLDILAELRQLASPESLGRSLLSLIHLHDPLHHANKKAHYRRRIVHCL